MKRSRPGPNSLLVILENDEGTRQARVEDISGLDRVSFYQRKPGEVRWEKVGRTGDPTFPIIEYISHNPAFPHLGEDCGKLWVEVGILPEGAQS